MKKLSFLLNYIDYVDINGVAPDVAAACLTFDSRKVQKFDNQSVTSIYVAQRGTQTDGHLYIPQAISAGAGVIVCEKMPEKLADNVGYILVKDSSIALG